MSGVAVGAQVSLIARLPQGCVPVAKPRRVSAAENHVVSQLDYQTALDVMLRDLHISMDQSQQARAGGPFKATQGRPFPWQTQRVKHQFNSNLLFARLMPAGQIR